MVKKNFLTYYLFLILLFIIGVFFFRELWPQKEMFSYGDRTPFPPDFQTGWEIIKTAWNEQTPGIALASGPPLFETILTFVAGNNGLLAQKINFVLPFFLAFCSIYYVMGRLGVKNNWARLIGGLIFAINPTVMGEIRGGAINTLYCSAFIPFIFWFLYQILWQEKNNLRNFLWLGIFSFLAFSFSDHIVIFIALFIFIFFLIKIFYRHEKGWLKKILFSIFFVLAAAIVFNISYFFDYLHLMTKAANPITRSLSQKQMFADLFTSYSHFKFFEILKLGGSEFYEKMFGGKFWSWAGFVIPLLFVLGLWQGFKKEQKPIKIFLVLLFTAVIIFILAIHWRWLDWLFKAFPLLFRFRNTARINLLLGFVFGVLAAGGVEWMIARAQNGSQKLKYLIFALVFLLLPLYLWSIRPILFGSIISGKNQKVETLPDYYQQIFDYLRNDRAQNKMARSFWFPWNYQVSKNIVWQEPMPTGLLIGYGQYTTSNYLNILNQLYEFLAQNKSDYAKQIFKLLNVKYIIVDRKLSSSDFAIKNGSMYLTPTLDGDAKKFEEIIKNFGDYQLAEENNDFAIYINPEIKGGEIKALSNLDQFYTSSPNHFFRTLLDNKANLKNAFELKIDKNFLPSNNFYSLKSSPVLIEEKFNNNLLDKDIWETDWEEKTLPAGKIILDAKQQGLGLRMPIKKEQAIEVNLRLDNTNNNEGNASVRAENSGLYGFSLGFDFETGSSAPVMHFNLKDSKRSSSKNLGRWDLAKHNYQFIRAENKIKLLIDGKEVVNEDFYLENELIFGIYNARQQKIAIDKFVVKDLDENVVFGPQKRKGASLTPIDFGKNDEQTYFVKNPSSRYLILLHPFDDGWWAKINPPADGQKIRSFEINGWLNGFDLDSNSIEQVKIYYRPDQLRLIAFYLNFAIITGACFCLLIIKKNP